MPTLKIKCEAAGLMPLSSMHTMQGNLKDLTTDNYLKLRRHIEKGFKYAFNVWLNPDDGKYYILDGHQRHRTLTRMQLEGWTIPPLPVSYIEAATLKEAEETLLGGSSSFGTPNEQGLYEWQCQSQLSVDEVIQLSSYSEIDFDHFVEEYYDDSSTPQATGDEDAVPDVDTKAPAVTQLGDIWLLGDHRVMCGDSTDAASVAILMNGEKADMVFTDPPYGVEYRSNMTKRFDVLMNDNIILDIYKIVIGIMKQNSAAFIWTSHHVYPIWRDQFKDSYKQTLIWSKGGGGMGDLNGQYALDYEMALFCTNGKPEFKRKRGMAVWQIGKDAASGYVHPTQKPVALAENAIEDFTTKNEKVIDLFLGSGSTLIACEKNNRKCYGMELDPHYCDVIVKRWQDFTGKTARRELDGKSFAERATEV